MSWYCFILYIYHLSVDADLESLAIYPWKRAVSSAYIRRPVLGMTSATELIQLYRKSVGTNIDPCRSPVLIGSSTDVLLFAVTVSFSNQYIVMKPANHNLSISQWYVVVQDIKDLIQVNVNVKPCFKLRSLRSKKKVCQYSCQ